MGKQEVVDYVMNSPHNTNRGVLSTLLNSIAEGINLPEVTSEDNGKVLTVVEGNWSAAMNNLVNGSANGSVRGISTQKENDNYTIGINAMAEGTGTIASGYSSHAEGGWTRAVGEHSHAEGSRDQNEAIIDGIVYNLGAIGKASHIEGFNNLAQGNYSHAEGKDTIAFGENSHAEGTNNKALGLNSHAEGGGTIASAPVSHAEGNMTEASGYGSHAEGRRTIASHLCQHAFGEYNIADTSTKTSTSRGNYVEIVGNGTSSNARSNARTLDWDGNEWLAGTLTLGQTTITEAQLQALLELLS